MNAPDCFSVFETQFNAGKTQLVWKFLPADLETPLSAYLKISAKEKYSFLLESVEGGATLGRYSIIGTQPDLIWSYERKDQDKNTLSSLQKALASTKIDIVPEGLPPMAVSGLFGYMGYGFVKLIENIPDTKPDDFLIPESILIRPGILMIFDNIKNQLCLVAPVYEHQKNSKESAIKVYKKALSKVAFAQKTIEKPTPKKLLSQKTKYKTLPAVQSNTSKFDFIQSVKKAISYIESGEIFQVVLGQRFSLDFDLPSIVFYRALRQLNPSPFMFHLNLNGFSLVGSSPEILVRVRDQKITIRPIAGTRKRGQTPQEDENLATELLNDPKERAEHLMLLDLGRNDVGRVAEIGSITVTQQFHVEHYSHVMHIVSNVEGKLRPDLDIIDALLAGFPAGTVSGAPKIRAMEIIDELEPSRRSYYGGGVGYLSGNGMLDSCISLRTALVKDGKIYIQAGAGIVADSNPEAEYQETLNKAQALIKAAELALGF